MIIMIHELNSPLRIPDKKHLLTFDDGLYSQYQYARDIDNPSLFFISTGIICPDIQSQSKEFIKCADAHVKAFEGNMENYMTIDQMLELPLGAHSHYHKDLTRIPKLIDKIAWIKQDTEIMLEFWEKTLQRTPTSFCFPYNNDLEGLYTAILRKGYGFTDFYGSDRINISEILV